MKQYILLSYLAILIDHIKTKSQTLSLREQCVITNICDQFISLWCEPDVIWECVNDPYLKMISDTPLTVTQLRKKYPEDEMFEFFEAVINDQTNKNLKGE